MDQDIRYGLFSIAAGIAITLLGLIIGWLFFIGPLFIIFGFSAIFNFIYRYISGWRKIEPTEIPKEVLTELNRVTQKIYSYSRIRKGKEKLDVEKQIRAGDAVYRIIAPKTTGKHGEKSLPEEPRYYKKKV